MTAKNASHKNSKPLAAEVLTNGAGYAMEQAWHLLRDAVLLMQNRRYASSLVLATYCLEQLGRVQIYRENAKKAFAGEIVTLDSMRRELTQHLAKLFKAQIPVTASTGFWGGPPTPGSEVVIQLAERLAAIRKRNEDEAAQKALDIRQRALHVDRISHFPGWNQPRRVVTRDDADYWLGAAEVRYGLLRMDLEKDGSRIGKRIWAAIEKFQLPVSPWDIWTWEEETNNSKTELARSQSARPY